MSDCPSCGGPHSIEECEEEKSVSKTKSKKSDLIRGFVDSLLYSQTEDIKNIIGRKVTRKTLIALFTKAFKKTISISSRKGKSRGCQQEICAKISEFTGLPWGKDEEIASREMGQSGADVRLSPTAQLLFPFSVECKDDGKWNIKTAIKQAQANTKPNTEWVVFHRQTDRQSDERIGMVAIIDADHFFNLLKEMKILRARQRLLKRS
jgi:hypothetical protein